MGDGKCSLMEKGKSLDWGSKLSIISIDSKEIFLMAKEMVMVHLSLKIKIIHLSLKIKIIHLSLKIKIILQFMLGNG